MNQLLNDVPSALPKQEGVEFRHVDGFPGYCVGNIGTVSSCWTHKKKAGFLTGWRSFLGSEWRTLTPAIDRKGYLRVHLRVPSGRSRTVKVHHLILKAFVGPRPAGCECRHLDGNPANNRVSNLCWGTPKENAQDTQRHGRLRPKRGEQHPLRKLTDAEVMEIRERAANG